MYRLLAPALFTWVLAVLATSFHGFAKQALFFCLLVFVFILSVLVIHFMAQKAAVPKVLRHSLGIALVSLGFLSLVLLSVQQRSELADELASQDALNTGAERVLKLREFPVALSEARNNFMLRGSLEENPAVRAVIWLRPTEEAEARKVAQLAPGDVIKVSGSEELLPFSQGEQLSLSVKEITFLSEEVQPYARFRTLLNEHAAKVSGASLVPGLAVGDTSLVNDKLDLEMKLSSLTHLTAVSGANCALITGVIIHLSSWLGFKRRSRLVLSAATLYLFVQVVGPDPSVLRAAIMAFVALISLFSGRKTAAYPALSVAIVLLLVIDPWQAKHPGFTLSVAATLGILWFVSPMEKALQTIISVPRWATLPFLVALAAQITCGPLLLLLQPGLPVAGIVANVVAAPAAPVGTALGLIAMLSLPVSSFIGVGVIRVASLFAKWIEATAEISANLPSARWFWPEGAFGALLLFISEVSIVVAIIIFLEVRPSYLPWIGRARFPQGWAVTIFTLSGLGLGVFVATTVAVPQLNRAVAPNDWAVVACDVGQGDAFLVRDPRQPDLVLMIDTGQNNDLAQKCLDDFGVQKIELLLLTHDDADHVGALDTVARVTKKALIAPDLSSQDSLNSGLGPRAILAKLESHGLPFERVSAQASGRLSRSETGGIDWRVIAPDPDAVLETENSSSVVLLVEVQERKILFLADTGAREHAELLRRYPNLKIDVVKTAHHGSKDQLSELYSVWRPSHALISVGAENRYGHPHPDVLQALQLNGVLALRTDHFGSVALIFKDQEILAWVEKRGVGD